MKTNWCRHYRGFQHETCEAGCRMADVDRGQGRSLEPPCFTLSRANKCPKHEPFTAEELAAQERLVAAALTAATKAKLAIVKHHQETGQCAGIIPCPTCGEDMHFGYSPSNGHAGAWCPTSHCTHFRE